MALRGTSVPSVPPWFRASWERAVLAESNEPCSPPLTGIAPGLATDPCQQQRAHILGGVGSTLEEPAPVGLLRAEDADRCALPTFRRVVSGVTEFPGWGTCGVRPLPLGVPWLLLRSLHVVWTISALSQDFASI